jgi:hypothetical protein
MDKQANSHSAKQCLENELHEMHMLKHGSQILTQHWRQASLGNIQVSYSTFRVVTNKTLNEYNATGQKCLENKDNLPPENDHITIQKQTESVRKK